MGGRTTKSQNHRQLASGLTCPVGFNENGKAGGVKVTANAVVQGVAKQVRGSAASWA